MKEGVSVGKFDDASYGNYLQMRNERSVFLEQRVVTVRGE